MCYEVTNWQISSATLENSSYQIQNETKFVFDSWLIRNQHHGNKCVQTIPDCILKDF